VTRTLHLNAFLKPAGEYLAGWRHPDSPVDAGVNFGFISGLVKRLEAARFDSIFLPDLVGIPDTKPEVLERVAVVNDALEPTTLLAALAAVTDRIGLIATASTSFSQPYALATTFASLDRLSHGRAGWNVVTSLNDSEARNFGLDGHLAHGDRYARAEEFYDTVEGLWDARASAQGRPVVAQAGSSGPGRALAARIAEIVFTRSLPIEQARAGYASIKDQAAEFGRAADQVLVLPELATVIAPSRAEAEDKFAVVRDLLHPRVALADVEYWLGGIDLASLPSDSPLPPAQSTNASVGTQQEIYLQAQRDGLTIGDLARLVAEGDGAIVGTPTDIADYIEEFFTTAAADGFNVSFPWLPTTLRDFADLVVPELQRRGLFRTEYEGATLRDNLGLARPEPRPRPERRRP
jgi:N-acetyl-S-(2-succino)cysteine monooxygenase